MLPACYSLRHGGQPHRHTHTHAQNYDLFDGNVQVIATRYTRSPHTVAITLHRTARVDIISQPTHKATSDIIPTLAFPANAATDGIVFILAQPTAQANKGAEKK